MCFNGAKSWALGWYEDDHDTMIPNAGERTCEGKFLAVDDYVNSKFDPNTHTSILYA
jgi:hypothetical protein